MAASQSHLAQQVGTTRTVGYGAARRPYQSGDPRAALTTSRSPPAAHKTPLARSSALGLGLLGKAGRSGRACGAGGGRLGCGLLAVVFVAPDEPVDGDEAGDV